MTLLWRRLRNFPVFVIAILLLVCLYTASDSGQEIRGNFMLWGEGLHTAANSRIHFSASTSIETTIPGGELVYGFGLLDRLYLRKGTFYIVTSTPSAFPQREHIIARPLDMGPDRDLSPTDKELQFIDPSEAATILGEQALTVEGFTLIAYDTEQFMHHFYHWWGEIILGAWRVYSALTGPSLSARDTTAPSFASRILLPHVFGQEWRDIPGLNAGLMRATFPSTSIENADQWDDLAVLDNTFVFERAMIVCRVAAQTHGLSKSWHKMISSTMAVNVSNTFWEPIRRTTVQNTIGYLPRLDSRGVIVSPPTVVSEMPFVTYIARQGSSRSLTDAYHQDLVRALKELEWSGLCQVYVAQMEKMSLTQQLEIMARSTILIGVHGNGLTHQLFMPPSSRSTVVEIFAPKGYVHDYAILARNLGHKHYAVWNDTLQTFPDGEWYEGVKYPSDFHSQSLPVYAPVIADLIRQRLSEPL
ncbi:hypothetical protein E4T56_gene15647 [Termitomyces sp. T112]|nr:hypothetical protein E4T56_gene15647 [Termitomyces sp. T112]